MAFGAIATGDMASLRDHIAEVADLLRTLGDKHEDPGWLWWTGSPWPVPKAATTRRSGWPARPKPSPGETASISTSSYAGRSSPGSYVPGASWVQAGGPLAVEGSRMSADELMDEALREADHVRAGPLTPGSSRSPTSSLRDSPTARSPSA